jgi:hypothetical protein
MAVVMMMRLLKSKHRGHVLRDPVAWSRQLLRPLHTRLLLLVRAFAGFLESRTTKSRFNIHPQVQLCKERGSQEALLAIKYMAANAYRIFTSWRPAKIRRKGKSQHLEVRVSTTFGPKLARTNR